MSPSLHGAKWWLGGWRRWFLVVVLIVAAGLFVESFPGAPDHDVAALLSQLAASDAGDLASKVNPFDSEPGNSCDRIESTYGVGNHLLKNDPFGYYASIWPSYQALEAFSLVSLDEPSSNCTRDFEQALKAIDNDYWSDGVRGLPAAYDQGPAALHASSDLPRVDDSMWMGMLLMEAYHHSKQEPLLERATAVLALGRANLDKRRGGIYWEDHAPGAQDWDKSVVSNAPAAVTAIDLYLATGRRTYLDWGEQILTWLEAHMLDHRDGLYDDHINEHPFPATVDRAKLTYNQGIMVGALALLNTISPQAYPLNDALSLAQRAMRYFRGHHSYGEPAFDLVWEKNVLWLAHLYRRPSFTAQARASLEAAFKAEPSHPKGLLEVSSEIALHALSKLSPDDYRALAP
jgi:hypothetical protein